MTTEPRTVYLLQSGGGGDIIKNEFKQYMCLKKYSTSANYLTHTILQQGLKAVV